MVLAATPTPLCPVIHLWKKPVGNVDPFARTGEVEGGEGWFVIPKHPDQMHAGDVKSFRLGEIEQLEWESSTNDTHLVCKITVTAE